MIREGEKTNEGRQWLKYYTTRALWRKLSDLRSSRKGFEEISDYLIGVGAIPPDRAFDYHRDRREILKVLVARTAKKAA